MHAELITRFAADAALLARDIAGLTDADLDARPMTRFALQRHGATQ